MGLYERGQLYAPHFDAVEAHAPAGRLFLQNGGQRVATLLSYLNTPAAGGCTAFPTLPLRVAPRAGAALLGAGGLALAACGATPAPPLPGPAKGRVVLLRGLINVFSTGMDDLGAKLRGAGYDATVHNHLDWLRLADEAVAHYAVHILLSSGRLESVRQVRREKEGDVEREYEDEKGTGVFAPASAYQRWEKLARVCRTGSISISVANPARQSDPWSTP